MDFSSAFSSVLVSSPGKVILHGEHAVVYGKPAIAASADLRCFLLLRPTQSNTVVLDLRDMQLQKTWSITQLCELLGCAEDEQMDVLKQFCGVDENPSMQNLACIVLLHLIIHIWRDHLRNCSGAEFIVSSQLPFGAGLGSSAAYSVCLASALLATSRQISRPQSHSASSSSSCSYEIPLQLRERLGENGGLGSGSFVEAFWMSEELEVINKWGFEAEKLIHGTPSGIDNSISVYGGAIKFQSGHFSSLDHMPQLSALVVFTKVPRSTKKMVASVRQKYEAHQGVVEPILDSIEEIVGRAEETLHRLCTAATSAEQQQLHTILQDLFCINHHLLNALGVGHPALDRVCYIAAETGLASKLTGAGGGGCAVVLLPHDIPKEKLDLLKSKMEEVGYECWETCIGGNGVCLHA